VNKTFFTSYARLSEYPSCIAALHHIQIHKHYLPKVFSLAKTIDRLVSSFPVANELAAFGYDISFMKSFDSKQTRAILYFSDTLVHIFSCH